jgi:hypothetical protein
MMIKEKTTTPRTPTASHCLTRVLAPGTDVSSRT